jgi:[ribosomal protein S5]-alanine N-acetyltransferase
MMPLEAFETAGFRAERLIAGHVDEIRRLHTDPQMMAMLGGVRDHASTSAYMARNLAHWEEHGFGIWVLRDPATGGVAGLGVLRHLDVEGADEVELGYALLPAYWGRGLATEIARTCVRLGLDTLALPSLVAITLPENRASQRVMGKAGLVYERTIEHGGLVHVLFRTAGEAGDQAATRKATEA